MRFEEEQKRADKTNKTNIVNKSKKKETYDDAVTHSIIINSFKHTSKWHNLLAQDIYFMCNIYIYKKANGIRSRFSFF